MDVGEEALRNLLAIVHRDGGHHASEHGLRASAEAAEAEVLRLRAELEAARAVVEQTKEVLADEDAYAKADATVSGECVEAWQTVMVSRMRLDDLIKAYDAAKAGKAVE